MKVFWFLCLHYHAYGKCLNLMWLYTSNLFILKDSSGSDYYTLMYIFKYRETFQCMLNPLAFFAECTASPGLKIA